MRWRPYSFKTSVSELRNEKTKQKSSCTYWLANTCCHTLACYYCCCIQGSNARKKHVSGTVPSFGISLPSFNSCFSEYARTAKPEGSQRSQISRSTIFTTTCKLIAKISFKQSMFLKVGNSVSESITLLMCYRFRNRTMFTVHTHTNTHTHTHKHTTHTHIQKHTTHIHTLHTTHTQTYTTHTQTHHTHTNTHIHTPRSHNHSWNEFLDPVCGFYRLFTAPYGT